MRTSEFDSSSDEEDVGEEQLTPFQISWFILPGMYTLHLTTHRFTEADPHTYMSQRHKLPLSVVECSQFLGICPLPGCKFKDVRRNLQRDVGELQDQGVEDVFVFCTRGELHKYRVPSLLETYRQQGFRVHHMPFSDGGTPELEQCCQILEGLQFNLQNSRRTVIHCYGGLGRSGLIAACLLLQLSVSMTPNKAIEILREHRGVGAIQTVKQYNFLHEFRERFSAYQETKAVSTERSVSR